MKRRRAGALATGIAIGLAAVPGGAAASPGTRDWEGTGAGPARASFLERVIVHPGSQPTGVIEDLAVQAPISCVDSPTPALPIDVEVVNGAIAVDARGRFSAGAIRDGSGTVVSGRVRGSPSSTDICAYETPVTLFVAADGSFGNGAWQEGDQALVTGRFSDARRARGTFTNGGEGCPSTSWTAGAG